MADEAQTRPSEITAVDGVVLVDGPDGVAVTLTMDAAMETGHRLIEAAVTANGQRVAAEQDKRHADRRRSIACE